MIGASALLTTTMLQQQKLIEALEEVGRQLDRARGAYRTARDRLRSGRGNLVRRAEQLKALGVKANKTLPASYATELDVAAEEPDPQEN